MRLLRKGLFWVIGIMMLISFILNINRQVAALLSAQKQNRQLGEEIRKIADENRELEQKIEYATSSAYLERQARNMFGLGRLDDYWIEEEEEEEGGKLYWEFNEDEEKSNWKMWLNLFWQD